MSSLETLVKELNALKAELIEEKDGIKIYDLDFGKDAVVGNPMFIVCEGNKCRITDLEESFKILSQIKD